MMMKLPLIALLFLLVSTSGCASRRIAKQPVDTNLTPEIKPNSESKKASLPSSSLWKGDSLSFLSTNKSWKIGDIIKIKVKIKGDAKFAGTKKNNKKTVSSNPITRILGKFLDFGMSTTPNLSALNQTTKIGDEIGGLKSGHDQKSSEEISKKESVNFDIAAVVKEILPGGNLIIEGTQEVTVHKEKRKILIQGIIRPKDINAENCIDSDKIAEARISYAIEDVQKKKKAPRF
jgi:flagellar L-ring protein FlgH